MSEEMENGRGQLIELTADIVSAYVSKNAVPIASLPDLIESVNCEFLAFEDRKAGRT